jgi:hypothetical protein
VASVIVNSAYRFVPNVTAASGTPLTFNVQNAPTWATFNSSNGQLSGTPSAADVGTYSNIVISVSDGKTSANLTPFSIAVTQMANGSAMMTWVPPTENTRGTLLTGLGGYRIYYGNSATSLTRVVQIANPNVLSYVVADLSPGTWFFSVEAYTSDGVSGDSSAVVSVSIM